MTTVEVTRGRNGYPAGLRLAITGFRGHNNNNNKHIIKMKKMKYFAEFRANGGSTYPERGYEYTNLREAIKEIKEIARGDHFLQAGNVTTVTVCDEDGEEIYRATLCGKSKQFRTIR